MFGPARVQGLAGDVSASISRPQKVKPGDLVKRRGCEWYAIILSVKPEESSPRERGYAKLYWIDEPPIDAVDQCHTSLLEVISAS